MIGNGGAPGELEFAGLAVEQAPVAAHRALLLLLPGLVEGLDDADAIVLPLRRRQHVLDHPSLVGGRRQRAVAHAPRARPADFADQDLLLSKCRLELLADALDMRRRLGGRDRKIFPIGQDVDGHEIDRRMHFRIAQPKLPDIRVGDGHRNPGFDAADQVGELGRSDLASQQGFVADHDGADRVREALGQRDRRFDLAPVALRIPADPGPLDHLHAVAPSDLGNPVEAEIRGIGPHAAGEPREAGQIVFDPAGVDPGRKIERGLVTAKRRVGYAKKLLAGLERRGRHGDRRAQPPPAAEDCRGNGEEKTYGSAHFPGKNRYS